MFLVCDVLLGEYFAFLRLCVYSNDLLISENISGDSLQASLGFSG